MMLENHCQGCWALWYRPDSSVLGTLGSYYFGHHAMLGIILKALLGPDSPPRMISVQSEVNS